MTYFFSISYPGERGSLAGEKGEAIKKKSPPCGGGGGGGILIVLFSYGNRKNKLPIDFSSPLFWRSNTCNFTSGWVQNRAGRGIGDRGPVTSIQKRCFHWFQCFCCAKKENMELQCIVYGCNNKEDEKRGIYIRQIPFYGNTRSEAVRRRRKWISFVNGSRKHWTPSKYSVVCSMHRKEVFTRTYSFYQQC